MMTTSFAALLAGSGVREIEIPIIQRDYAQGRPGNTVTRIRDDFLDALHHALTKGPAVNLDFVYGHLENYKLVPLDGQQRLTTLFLLHVYLAPRAGVAAADFEKLPRVTYETRSSSRIFCRRLREQRAQLASVPSTTQLLSAFIRDQSWFLATWQHDPTIASMLVMLDAIHQKFAGSDCAAAWRRLTADKDPAVVFHFLPIADMGLTDDLYIKMNSRGKPLTAFERWKAGFEELIRTVSPARYDEFCTKIDSSWSDVLWAYRSKTNEIDDQMMRYIRYVTDMLAYKTLGKLPNQQGELEYAAAVYGPDNAHAKENLDFLFSALDCWEGEPIAAWFKDRFAKDDHQPGKVTRFEDVDLFESCCSAYGRTFARELMLFGVLLHLSSGSPQFPQRIRLLRNLVAHTDLRGDKMPELLDATRKIILDGTLVDVAAFNAHQLTDERRKATFITAHPTLAPTLYRLEDHGLLRGRLLAFDLDAASIERQAATFAELFATAGSVEEDVRGALLACGDYSQRNRSARAQFGPPGGQEIWRALLTDWGATRFINTKAALQGLLDQVGADTTRPLDARVFAVRADFLAQREKVGELDWRYYMVKYSAMREGESGLFVSGLGHMGFDLCMMDKTVLRSYYRDPYLYAVAKRAGALKGRDVKGWWFFGHEERRLELVPSGAQLLCSQSGYKLRAPQDARYQAAFDSLKIKYGIGADLLLKIPQKTRDSELYDTEDRVERGAQLLKDLLAMKPS